MAEFLTIELLTFNCRQMRYCTRHIYAGMAKLADALDLGSSGRPCRFKSCCPYYLQGFQRFLLLLKFLFFYHFSYTKGYHNAGLQGFSKSTSRLKRGYATRILHARRTLFDYGSFDICRSDDKYIIPYIMNDAVECYLTVENAVLKGDYHSEEEIISASLVLGIEKGYGLILHQQDNVVTLWFDNLHVHEACFKYHEIGHFWVKGQEQWRMLVYMVGTIADKYMYMGKEYCNETECFIQSLIYFAPFRRWTPVPAI